jgi:hypothetical protein
MRRELCRVRGQVHLETSVVGTGTEGVSGMPEASAEDHFGLFDPVDYEAVVGDRCQEGGIYGFEAG